MTYARKKRGGEAERITIIIVIIIAMLLVAISIGIQLFNTPERIVKSKVENMAADYYENYFYKKIIKNSVTKESLKETLDKYHEQGFSHVAFRQLLLFDNEKYSELTPLITKYCDENVSSVVIYPDPPYNQTDYHIEYYYSCEF